MEATSTTDGQAAVACSICTPLCNPVPTHGLGCERCRVRVNEQFGRSRLAHPRSNKIFSIHQANNSSVRVRRSIRCASEATAEHTAPHRPPVGLKKKERITNIDQSNAWKSSNKFHRECVFVLVLRRKRPHDRSFENFSFVG